MNDVWISVRNWSRYQHYDPKKRGQIWIKDYVGQIDEDAYRELSLAQRGLLHGIRMVYQKSRCELRMDTPKLSQRLGVKVTRRSLQPLIDAGFIDIVASSLLADGYQAASHPASTEGEGEGEGETPLPPLDIPVEDLPPFSSRADELLSVIEAAKMRHMP